MRVTVRCFARLRDLTGRATWTCDVEAPATVADVWASLVAAHPAAAAMASAVSCARNLEFSAMDAPVAEGDEVAFLPPVSGGAQESDDTRGS